MTVHGNYPADEPYIIDIGDRHFLMEWGGQPPDFIPTGYLWHHDGPTPTCSSWGWFGLKDGQESGHRIVSHQPLTVEGSLICPDCGDHGFIRDSRWVVA